MQQVTFHMVTLVVAKILENRSRIQVIDRIDFSNDTANTSVRGPLNQQRTERRNWQLLTDSSINNRNFIIDMIDNPLTNVLIRWCY